MAMKDAPGISIDDKPGVGARVQQHAVGGFRPDAVDSQQTLADLGRLASEQARQVPPELLDQHAEK